VWSIVAGVLCQSLVAALLNYAAVRHPWGLSADVGRYRRLLVYGGRLSVISFLEFIGYSVEPLVIGRFLGASALGFYSNAQRLSNYATEKAVTGLTRVLFPSFSAAQRDRDRLRGAFLSSYAAIGLVAVSASVLIAVAAPQIVEVLLGPKWLPAVVPLRLLSLAAPFTFLSHLLGVLLDAVAELTAKMVVNIVYIFAAVVLVAVGLRYGLAGVIGAYIVVEAAYWFACLVLVRPILSATRSAFRARHLALALGVPAWGVLAIEGVAALVPLAWLAVWPPLAVLRADVAGVYRRLHGAADYRGPNTLLRWYVNRNRAWLFSTDASEG
jgi:lipopolysaccharide exporter